MMDAKLKVDKYIELWINSGALRPVVGVDGDPGGDSNVVSTIEIAEGCTELGIEGTITGNVINDSVDDLTILANLS